MAPKHVGSVLGASSMELWRVFLANPLNRTISTRPPPTGQHDLHYYYPAMAAIPTVAGDFQTRLFINNEVSPQIAATTHR
jgi:hypothetical protein